MVGVDASIASGVSRLHRRWRLTIGFHILSDSVQSRPLDTSETWLRAIRSQRVSVNTIVARLTPALPAAIATLGISGPQAISCVTRFVRLPGNRLDVGSLRYGVWEIAAVARENVRNSIVERRPHGEQVVLTRPDSDTVEVHCHGGAAVCQALLDDLVDAGCVVVTAERWPSRLGCRLARAAEEDLLNTTTDRAAAVLLDQLNGALRRALEHLARHLESDGPGCLASASLCLERLLRWADFGLHLSQPWRIVLVGPPNVGKSSLLNALAGTRQAIVHHEPGTTRDWIEWSSAIDGWPVAFTDTAGVRAADESIEQAGIERSLQRLAEADLVLLIVDSQQGWTDEHARLLELSPVRRLVVWNKVDLDGCVTPRLPLPTRNLHSTDMQISTEVIATSAIEGTGVASLLDAMARMLVPETPEEGAAIPFRIEHIHCLTRCRERIQQRDAPGAAALLRCDL